MKNKIVWIFLLIISVGFFFYFSKNQFQKEQFLSIFLREQYSDKFILKSWSSGNFIVTSALSTTTCCGEGSNGAYDEKAAPSVIIQDLNTQKIQSLYEISFTTEASDGKFDRGNNINLYDFKPVKDYFIGVWEINWGGSSGFKGIIIFSNKDGQIKPVAGYPFSEDPKPSINIVDKLKNTTQSFPIVGDTDFTEVTDLNNDGKIDLLFADWKWDFDKGESHYTPRPWNLQVFELFDEKFIVAKW
ncbi:MAG: hypothetical protein EXS44_01885 [Candidatus Levybacteria bacterium]|nr:hypothetical protein [Candidatus Levybacteria bacterium]